MKNIWFLFWCIILNCLGNSQQYSEVNIGKTYELPYNINIEIFLKYILGALFFEDELDIEKTFEATVERINSENEGLFKLTPLIRRLNPEDGSIALEREGF